jgi:hypothetical protein
MGWSGRVPAPPMSNADEGAHFRSMPMLSRKSGQIAVVGNFRDAEAQERS